MARSYRLYCSVYGCLNSSISKPDITFFKLPSQAARLSEWLRLICRDDLANKSNVSGYRICETHFNERDILPTINRRVLKKNALPSINLPDFQSTVQEGSRKEDKPTQTVNAVHHRHTQTTKSLSCGNTCKRKLKNELFECRKKLKLYETQKAKKSIFHNLCDNFLTKELALLVKAQTSLNVHGKGNRYEADYIIFCLNLYFTSPQAYRYLQSALCLPCTTTLYKHSFPITTDINEKAMCILKIKVEQMTETEKNCSVMLNAMPLKRNLSNDIKEDKYIGQSSEPAKLAFVIMVRGIFVKWKQPIAYTMLPECNNCDDITKWVDKILRKLFEIGLNIRTFITDQGSDLWNAAKKRSVSIEKPYFFINDRRIYYIFDAPHLIKNVRNNLMQYDFHFGNSVAKYKHVVQFYNQDIKTSCRLAGKLTNSHIHPTNYKKMKVSYATQLLSKSVATGISTCIDNNYIDKSGRGTAKVITMMNDLFDSLNSSNLRHNYEYKRAYAGLESQKIFFREMLCFFQDLKLINPKNDRDCTSNVRFIEGFQITITSLSLLFEDLRLEGYTFIFTRRFNQDALKILFDQIRTQNGLVMNPTCRQFVSAFKKIFFSNIVKIPHKGEIRSADLGQLVV